MSGEQFGPSSWRRADKEELLAFLAVSVTALQPGANQTLDCHYKAHWKLHNAVCAQRDEITQIKSQLPTNAATMVDELHRHALQLSDELDIATRTAFKLGRSDCISRSHIMHLEFTWDPEKPSIRERFILDYVDVMPVDQYQQQGGADSWEFCETVRKAGNLGKPDDQLPRAREVLVGYIFQATIKKPESQDIGLATIKARKVRIDETSFESMLPISMRKPNPDWEVS